LEIIPSKLVFTIKPSPDDKAGKKKTRWVVCGNHEERRDGEENYSAGADATALRLLAWVSSKMRWAGCTLDHADMEQDPDEDLLLVRPPHILKETKFLRRDVLYQPLRAVYSFRRSPKLWGAHRDSTMRGFRIEAILDEAPVTLRLKPMESEQSLWKVVVEKHGLQEDEEELISKSAW
jgi:hypothetical protein